MCAQDIEISLMGDHICAGPNGAAAGEPTPPPDSNGNFDRMPYKRNATNGPSYLRPTRAPPPRVDTGVANRPFYPQDQLTPVSASPSRSVSPMSDGQISPFMRPSRNATHPVNRAPPSPELLSSNLDSAFPPFPGMKVGPQKSKQGGGYGGMGKMLMEPESMYAPVSPRTAASGGMLSQRMNTIAPGPFDGRRKASGLPSIPGHRRNGSLADSTMSTGTVEIGGTVRRPSNAVGHSRTSTSSSNGSRIGSMGSTVSRKQVYGGFIPPSADDTHREFLTQESRWQTFPLKSESPEALFRRPSEPHRPFNDAAYSMSSEADRSISPARERRRPSISGPDLTRAPPPRGVMIRPRADARLGDASLVPNNLNLAAEFGIGNPYHTPTESSSSNTSGSSDQSKASSRSSPPRSRRKPSDEVEVDTLMADLESSIADMGPRKMASGQSPPTTRNQYPRMQPQILPPSMQSPESPMDPAIQFGRLSPAPLTQRRSPSPSRSDRQQPPLQRPSTANRPTTANRPNTGSRPATSKGDCKGCGEPIKGKSVSSADGRLTGRYHKQCFVCKTCAQPFQTSTFYVMDDSPYCERHYHKLNGSVCTTCDKGIEGQYLESERRDKFHPGCLTCADCKRNLRHDYFEMNGRVYCERDAFRRAQTQPRAQGPNFGNGATSNKMERRTTRLMMM
ncbi:related to PXL1 LIM domain-containing protein that localizes to sites of polarized growth, required for selection and/or maintenance of polarized growth sites [Rhynchosporium graminicola]|uniref:Related to PXL1 LIM domain-containing protein that localizes to sites of polarized growth, required for selection and/or maintenance of polarized growth sites n=1 Tax=Rhynchosporium graminicola TaxID=2792576 RepID=A0A1E1JQ82_9HELO|nr:related to PXL1 LIM domain-containing protein that localizes to sites of polarized growth, required for selection and/or maintenance of polarized growth sites [Rhynchosporium commune]